MIAAYKFAASPSPEAQILLRNLRAELCDLKNAALQQRMEAYGVRDGRPWMPEADREGVQPRRYGGPRVARRGGILVSHAEVEDPVCDCGSKKKWRLCHGQAEIAETTAALQAAFPGLQPAHVLLPVRERRLSLQRQISKSRCQACGLWCAVVGFSACHGAELVVPDKAEEIPDDIGTPGPGQILRTVRERLRAAGEGSKKVCATCFEPVGRQIRYLSACHGAEVQQYAGQSEDLTALREANAEDPGLSTTVRRPGKGRRRARIRHDEVPRAAQTDALERLEKAYNNAFSRIARGDKAGFPRYQKRRDYGSIGIQWEHGVSLEGVCPSCQQQVGTPDARTTEVHAREAGKRVTDKTRCSGSEGPLREPGLPILVIAWGRGQAQRRVEVPLRIHVSKPLFAAARALQEGERSVGQPGSFRRAVAAVLKAQPELGGIQGTPKHCVLVEEADGRWFAVIQCEDVPVSYAPPTEREIGIDLGWSEMETRRGAREVLAVIVDDQGQVQQIPHPAFGEQAAPRLEAAQRVLALKLRPSLSIEASQAAGKALAAQEGQVWKDLSKRARRAYLLRAVHGKRVARQSKRRDKRAARVKVAQAIPRRQGADLVHKLSHGLVYGGRVAAVAGVEPFSVPAAGKIAVEKMAIRQMVERTRNDPDVHDSAALSRRNLDSRWGMLTAQIASKGAAAGRTVVEQSPGKGAERTDLIEAVASRAADAGLIVEVWAEKDQKRGGRIASAQRILDAGRALWSGAGASVQTEGASGEPDHHTGGDASPKAGAGPVPETSRATKPRRGRNRRLGEAGGGGTDAPARGGREGSSPGAERRKSSRTGSARRSADNT